VTGDAIKTAATEASRTRCPSKSSPGEALYSLIIEGNATGYSGYVGPLPILSAL
jgi:hypothetical protein